MLCFSLSQQMKYTWVCSYPLDHEHPTPENGSLPLIFTHPLPSFQLTSSCGPGTKLFCISHPWLLILSAISSLKPSYSNQCFWYSPFWLHFKIIIIVIIWIYFLYCIGIFFIWYSIEKLHEYTVGIKSPFIPHVLVTESPFVKATTVRSFLSIFWEMAFETTNICVYTPISFSLNKLWHVIHILHTWHFPLDIGT